MATYHVASRGAKAGQKVVCTARVQCRIGGQHYTAISKKDKMEISIEQYEITPSFENYKKFADSQKEFDRSADGLKALEEEIEAIKAKGARVEDIFALHSRLDTAQQERELALKLGHDPDKIEYMETEQNTGVLIHDGLPYDPATKGISESFLFGEYDKNTKKARDPHQYWRRGRTDGVVMDYTSHMDYDYDNYGCTGSCDEDDMCRCARYSGLRLKNFTTQNMLADTLGLEPERITPRMIRQAENLGIAHEIEVTTTPDYYGENAGIFISNEGIRKLQTLVYDQTNVDAPAFSYMRSEGLSSRGHSPIQAVKEITKSSKLPANIKKKIKDSNFVTEENVNLNRVNVPESIVKTETPYVFPPTQRGIAKDVPAGILLKEGKEMTLIHGHERFLAAQRAAAQKASLVRWTFIVIEK